MPVTAAWLKVAGVQAVVRWQSSQVLVVARCVAVLPVAVVPLWQEKQFPVMPEWLNVAGVQPLVRWQSSHALLVARWVAVFPLAVRPL